MDSHLQGNVELDVAKISPLEGLKGVQKGIKQKIMSSLTNKHPLSLARLKKFCRISSGEISDEIREEGMLTLSEEAGYPFPQRQTTATRSNDATLGNRHIATVSRYCLVLYFPVVRCILLHLREPRNFLLPVDPLSTSILAKPRWYRPFANVNNTRVPEHTKRSMIAVRRRFRVIFIFAELNNGRKDQGIP
jgi:hypothetical protein